ncbi:MAG TPA: TonB-dependent receptor, partial [Azonexus sp.]|nr:TonB-dependent receptor [Azonexus sp.]
FGDFVGAAELTNDRIDGGNPDLLPQRAWEYRLTVERPVLGDGRLQVQLGFDRISLLQDRVPIEGGGDAPGNLGTGTRLFVNGTVDVPLASLGITGGRFTATGVWRDTSVRDPYTGQDRFFSGQSKWYAEAGFRQDLGSWAWGVNWYAQPKQSVFRRNEIDSFDGDEPFLTGFVEYRPTQATAVRLGVENIADVRAGRTRLFFQPDRTVTTPSAVEVRERNRHVTVALSLRHNFG